jgi:hypothetical protein
MEWTDALRKHAEMTGKKWHIPKKGTAEYDAVKKLQAGGGAAAPAADKKAARAALKAEAMEGVAKGVYVAEAGKGVSFKAKGAPKIQLKRKGRSDKGKIRSDKRAVEVAPSKVMPKPTHLKFDDEGKVKRPRKVRSDKGKKRGARKPKEGEVIDLS